jgi:hypothetical protein
LETECFVARPIERVGVDVETLVESPLRVQDVGADEGRSHIAAATKDFSDELDAVGHGDSSVVPNPVVERIGSGENGNVRGKCQGGLSDTTFEDHTFSSQPVYVRSIGPLAVGAHMVGTQRVNRNEDDVEIPE